MTDAKQFHAIQETLETASHYDLRVCARNGVIYVENKFGHVLNNGFYSAEEVVGWMTAYRDFKQGVLK